ncbi:MAG: STAS domain-containing protein [Ignavibacteriae bacterium]|nr:STAS domain-containing protein [Ignavibacteriota bacterium]
METKKSNITIDSTGFLSFEVIDSEVGLTNLNDLKEEIISSLDSGSLNIAVDLKNVSVINSSGLGILIGCMNRVKSAKGNFKILNPTDKIENLFKITKLNLVFEIIRI